MTLAKEYYPNKNKKISLDSQLSNKFMRSHNRNTMEFSKNDWIGISTVLIK